MKPFDQNGSFQLSVDGTGLRRLAVRGAGISVFAQGATFVVQMVGTIVLARLLVPADFGLVAMVTTFSLLLMSFGQNGYSEAVIQRDLIDHFLASNLFWINLGAGVLLAIGFAASGSLLAKFYGDPRVAYVCVGMSLTIFTSSASVVHLALLKRAMRFALVSRIDIAARTVSVAVSILLALAGWKYWALVAGCVSQPLTTAIAAWSQCRWVPGAPRRVAGTGSVARFALNVYGRFIVNHFVRNMDNLLVGWRFGPGALGFYKKAYDLFVLPANQLLMPVSDVALSTLSRFTRKTIEYKQHFLNGLAVLAFVGMGIGAGLTLVAKDLIRLLLGPNWETAGTVFTFFGPGIGIMLVYGTTGMIHLSIGRADRWLRWVVVEFMVTGFLFLLGLRWGPMGIAAAWTASYWVLTIPAFWYGGRPIQLGIAPVVAVVWRYVVGSLLAACGVIAIERYLPFMAGSPGALPAFARIAMTSALFSTLYVGATILLHGGTYHLRRLIRLLSDLIPRNRSKSSPAIVPEAAV